MSKDKPRRSDRLSAVVAQDLKDDSLVGSYFHSDHKRGWQGCVVAEPAPGLFLIETFEWLVGGSHDQRLVRLDEMAGWCFYDYAEWMDNAYETGVQERWARERKEEGAS